MAGTDPTPIYTGAHVKVEIAGISDTMDTLLFSSCTTPSWSIEVPKHVFHGDSNMPYPVASSVQRPSWGTMTLTQGWDKDHVMATWKAVMESNKALSEKWKQVTVTWYDSDGTTAFLGYTTEHGLLVGYGTSGSNAATNDALTVTVTLDTADTWQLTDGSAPITA